MKSLLRRTCATIGVVALISGGHNTASATQLVRELWDGGSGQHPIDGVVSNDMSTLGLNPNTTWMASPAGNTSLRFDNWNLDWEIGDSGTLLPPTANGNGGLLAYYGGNGNMETTLTNPVTSLPYGDYSSQCYATRALSTNAYINFQANGTYYFSVTFIGGGGYNWWSGDMAGGIGLASSSATNADFVGFGWTRLSPFYLADGTTDVGSSLYVTAGTLNQPGSGYNNDANGQPTDGGPYYPRAAGAIESLTSTPGSTGAGNGGILIGQLITTPSGASTISVLRVGPYGAIPTDPSAITWDATYSFTETNVMTRLLVWENGTGPAVMDPIRVGTTLAEAIGVEVVGAPIAAPSNPVYAGTTVTLSTTYAGLNSGSFPLSYQWLSNNVPIDPTINSTATNASLVLPSTTTNFTADYSLLVTNGYGSTTGAVTHLTVNPATPVYITSQPVSITRYLGSPAASFTVGVNGTPPYTYQWTHAVTNFQPAVTTSAIFNTLSLPPITAANAGNYQVVITNQFGSVTSVVATLTEIVPTAGSYAAAVTALSPWGYWRLDDNGNADSTIYDYFSWNNGAALDTNNMTFGAAGAPDVGWPSPHNATSIGNQWWASAYRLNLPQLPIYTPNMTFTMWVNNNNNGLQLLADNGYGNEYGLQNNNGDLQFSWGGITAWDSGLNLPANTWTFVALVVQTNQVTIYMGTNQVSLVSSANTSLTLSDSTTLGDTPYLTPLAVGRNPIPWAEGGNGSQWASNPGSWSDIAIFYQPLTATQVQNLYLAGVGLTVQGTPDGSGNLILNWISGATLQEASSLTGPWTDVGGSPTPPYSVPMLAAQKFYRVRN
jgi:hypothetical protein